MSPEIDFEISPVCENSQNGILYCATGPYPMRYIGTLSVIESFSQFLCNTTFRLTGVVTNYSYPCHANNVTHFMTPFSVRCRERNTWQKNNEKRRSRIPSCEKRKRRTWLQRSNELAAFFVSAYVQELCIEFIPDDRLTNELTEWVVPLLWYGGSQTRRCNVLEGASYYGLTN